ncbi:MAG: LPS export ABC transporter ATP-binding protein [Tepidisphaeraceae bacterium]|jgi:lipopolysaccharide export system ATP-binding protein
MALLEANNLVKIYQGRRVVDQISFVLQPREIVGLLGRNGSGKTTTFRMVIGMATPDEGTVVFDGCEVTWLPMYQHARLGIGYLPQERSDFRNLSVWNNLMIVLETLKMNRRQRAGRASELLEFFGLLKDKKLRSDHLSGGQRRKLEIARALCTQPKLILLDEPFSGVDPITVEDLQREIQRLRAQFGQSLLVSDHNVTQTLAVCDRALIIHEGRKLAEGTPRQIINDPAVRSVYLGNTFRGDEFG